MHIAGYNKTTLVDYPGKVAAILFLPYCNMSCAYCHNKVLLEQEVPHVEEEEVLSFLKKRSGILDGVVITGGEPTLHRELPELIKKIKSFSYSIKLDTNGTNPDMLAELVSNRMVDYVAMDIKAPPERYPEVAGKNIDVEAVQRSVQFLLKGDSDYEFRTTFAPMLQKEDILKIATWIRGTRRYYLQQYRPTDTYSLPAHSDAYLEETAKKVREEIGVCDLRGL